MSNVAELEQENDQLKDQVGHLKCYIEQLEQALIVSRQQRFGASSEKGQGQQLLIFDEAEQAYQADQDADATPESETIVVAGHI